MHIHIIIFELAGYCTHVFVFFTLTEKEEKGKLFMLYFTNNKEFPLTFGFNS